MLKVFLKVLLGLLCLLVGLYSWTQLSIMVSSADTTEVVMGCFGFTLLISLLITGMVKLFKLKNGETNEKNV